MKYSVKVQYSHCRRVDVPVKALKNSALVCHSRRVDAVAKGLQNALLLVRISQ